MFHGSITAIVTPMFSSGELDLTNFKKLLAWQILEGTTGIVIAGSTGESATLDYAERAELISTAIAICANKIPVIAGTGSNCTRTTIKLTKQAQELGVAACLIVTPYYNKPTQRGLYEHYRAIAEQCAGPILLYNVPVRTCCDLLPETVAKLARIPNIIGIKEATGDITRVATLKNLCGTDFLLFTGDDFTAVEFIKAGGHGNISAVANVMPNAMARICSLALSHDFASATALDLSFQVLYRGLFLETNPIAIKWALSELGMIQQGIRLPLTTLSEQHQQQLREILQSLNLISANLATV